MTTEETHNAEMVGRKVHSVTTYYGEQVTAKTECGRDATRYLDDFGGSWSLVDARLNGYLCKKCYPGSA